MQLRYADFLRATMRMVDGAWPVQECSSFVEFEVSAITLRCRQGGRTVTSRARVPREQVRLSESIG